MAQKPIQIDPILKSGLTLAEHSYRRFSVQVPRTVTKDILTDHRLWVHVAGQLNVLDEIRVVADDLSYRALLIVTFSDFKNIRMKLVEYCELEECETMEQMPEEYTVEQRGQRKWCVIRLADGEIIKDNIQTRPKALQELDEYIAILER
jgi:hypothetical protein